MEHPNQGGDKASQFPVEFLNESNWLKLHNRQTSNFGNRSVSGTEQPAPGAPDFAYNEIQTLSSHDKELNQQQCDQFIVDTLKMVQLPTMPSRPPDASYSMDQFGTLPASGTQLPENQMPAGIQPLIQEQLGPAAEKEQIKLEKKRACDRAYRQKKKDEEQELKNKCQELENANQVMDQLLKTYAAQMEDKLQKEQQHLEKIAKVEAEKELAEKKCLLLTEKKSQLRQKVKAMKKKYKNLRKQCIEKPKKKLKKQVMMAETSEDTKNDN
ncbi:hypothetical protein SLEP1_g58539 [Rubroshorea leprosula]|uniref:Uncharacterized protein n=1 Tax=Rubroshorea leprosula TaxID=152421 RepID=A0AAV5MT91_9ROSI|nr:hypothetical protein SLEP1_g58539 [Rubroshorea leprosula]